MLFSFILLSILLFRFLTIQNYRLQLHDIGIMKDELELSGELDTLLKGEKTKVMPLKLVLLGVDVVMDATLQLVRKGEAPLLEIQGVTPLGR